MGAHRRPPRGGCGIDDGDGLSRVVLNGRLSRLLLHRPRLCGRLCLALCVGALLFRCQQLACTVATEGSTRNGGVVGFNAVHPPLLSHRQRFQLWGQCTLELISDFVSLLQHCTSYCGAGVRV
jgi:hypothetical protein